MSNFVIKDKFTLKNKIEMIETLSDMKIATKILDDKKEDDHEDELLSLYTSLKCKIDHIDKGEEVFSTLEKYLHNSTSDNTYQKYKLIEAFQINREGEEEKFVDYGNKKLLWHGSRITNFVGILSQGLRIAPPEAPSSGYLFGKGVYFADMASKSLPYCYPSNRTALILLCEVALGCPNELLTTDHNASNLPSGKHSTKGCGRTCPCEEIDLNGVSLPIGLPKTNTALKVIFYKLDLLGI
jgi:poly [ADP-ribose] polymerase